VRLTALATLAALTLLASPLLKAESPPLEVQGAWVRTTPGSDVAAVYL